MSIKFGNCLAVCYALQMKITAVRHGETDANAHHITQSQAPGILTHKGVKQAKKLAVLLQDERFDVVYSSDLKRAADTALIIMEKHPGVKLVYTPLLRERSLGSLDGMPYESIPPELYEASNVDLRAPNGESWHDVMKRLVTFLNGAYEAYPQASILLVAHGWTIKIMRYLLTDFTLEASLPEHIGNATAQKWFMTQKLDLQALKSNSTNLAIKG